MTKKNIKERRFYRAKQEARFAEEAPLHRLAAPWALYYDIDEHRFITET